MATLLTKALHNPSERVLVSISPANYTHTDGGLIVLKNSPRMRLYLDRTLLSENGFERDRLELKLFSESKLCLVFEAGHIGLTVSPIPKSGRSEIAIPLSKLRHLTADAFPKVRKAQCSYQFRGDKLIVALPFALP